MQCEISSKTDKKRKYVQYMHNLYIIYFVCLSEYVPTILLQARFCLLYLHRSANTNKVNLVWLELH